MFENAVRNISGLTLILIGCAYALDMRSSFGFSVDAVARESTECGSVYRVAPGDTLQKIAMRAYGTVNYQVIFEANRNTLKNAASLDVGDELLIPCQRGASPRIDTRTAARILNAEASPVPRSRPDSAENVVAASIPSILADDGTIDFLTGSDFAPFVHTGSPEGGLTTELVRLAMSSAGRKHAFRIALVEDWSVHLDLLERGKFDVGFPWYRPDCTSTGKLGASMQRRCARFDFSDPLFEVVIGYYGRANDPLTSATRYAQLSGRRICRPASHFTFDLEQRGLTNPNAALITPSEVSDCLAMLERGEVDVVTLSKLLADEEIIRQGYLGKVAEIPGLVSSQTLHVVARKGDPTALAYLIQINAGLANLRASGRWFEVVSAHFGAYGVIVR